ncbi:ATP-binding protein [Variovorax sp. 38R]|uniref:ATP-binding protein n=1 Tax=Variovorax sp. 38R TaxID=2774875 RepID=UPI0017860E76|nr:ATP-binding protein [Variovorax sp. 38R]QOF77442.1 ATP-binding protein [Variovorax sp. 38R]
MYGSQLGLIIATVIGLGLVGVLALMGALFFANARAAAHARGLAQQARTELHQQLADSRVQDLRPLLGAESGDATALRLDVDLPAEAVPVFGIPSELRELLAKVAAHAARVMAAGATLQVRARIEGTQAVIHWRDLNAEGERPPLARFFDALDTASLASARICERIAGRHGGRIYSAPDDGGVLGLTLRLPLYAPVAAGSVD